MGSWNPFTWPTEPPGLSDMEWWEWEARAAEREARPTYDELMEQYDNEIDQTEWIGLAAYWCVYGPVHGGFYRRNEDY